MSRFIKTRSEDISTRAFAEQAIIFALQLVLTVVLYNTIVHFIKRSYVVSHDISWGIAVEYLFIELVTLLLFQKAFLLFFSVKRWFAFGITTLVYLSLLLPYFASHPYRTLHVLLVAVTVIWLPATYAEIKRRVTGAGS